jgi:hypothetical protein
VVRHLVETVGPITNALPGGSFQPEEPGLFGEPLTTLASGGQGDYVWEASSGRRSVPPGGYWVQVHFPKIKGGSSLPNVPGDLKATMMCVPQKPGVIYGAGPQTVVTVRVELAGRPAVRVATAGRDKNLPFTVWVLAPYPATSRCAPSSAWMPRGDRSVDQQSLMVPPGPSAAPSPPRLPPRGAVAPRPVGCRRTAQPFLSQPKPEWQWGLGSDLPAPWNLRAAASSQNPSARRPSALDTASTTSGQDCQPPDCARLDPGRSSASPAAPRSRPAPALGDQADQRPPAQPQHARLPAQAAGQMPRGRRLVPLRPVRRRCAGHRASRGVLP